MEIKPSTKDIVFYNKNLYELFQLDVIDLFLFKVFLNSKFSNDKKFITSQKEEIIQLLSNKSFLNEFNTYIDKYITDSKEQKRNNLKRLKEEMNKISTDSTEAELLSIVKNTELIGDMILNYIVDDILIQIKNNKNEQCLRVLNHFLKSNVLLYNIVKKSSNLNIADFFPSVFKYEIRLSKRKDINRDEKLDTNCIDFKYYANLVEQIIGFLFITKGYTKTSQIFQKVLNESGFNPKDFIKNCNTPYSKPYDGLVLRPGCSCEDKNRKKICDNPEVYEPRYIKNLNCSIECQDIDVPFFLKSKLQTQIESIKNIISNPSTMFKEIINSPREIFTSYIFNWRRTPHTIQNNYLMNLLNYILGGDIARRLDNHIYNLLLELQKDIQKFQDQYDEKEVIDKHFNLLLKNKEISFPEAYAIVQKYPPLLQGAVKNDVSNVLDTTLNLLKDKYKNISEGKKDVSKIFTIGLGKKEKQERDKEQGKEREKTRDKERGKERGKERKKDYKPRKSRERSRSRERKPRRRSRERSSIKKNRPRSKERKSETSKPSKSDDVPIFKFNFLKI